jgi:rRNA maturation protein Nop10
MRGHFFSIALVLYDRSEKLCGFEQTEPKGNRLGAGRFTVRDRSAHSTSSTHIYIPARFRPRNGHWIAGPKTQVGNNAATTGTLS